MYTCMYVGHVCVCVCVCVWSVCACVRACARAFVHECMHACMCSFRKCSLRLLTSFLTVLECMPCVPTNLPKYLSLSIEKK